jgi:hypothetical protein
LTEWRERVEREGMHPSRPLNEVERRDGERRGNREGVTRREEMEGMRG